MTMSNMKPIETATSKILLIPGCSISEPEPREVVSLFDDRVQNPVARREVLRRLAAGGVVVAGLGFLPVQRAEAAFPWGVLVPIVTTLINALFDRPKAQPIVNAVRRTPIVRRRPLHTFHDQFPMQAKDDDGEMVPVIFDGFPVPVTRTRYGSYFGLDQLPRHDRTSEICTIKDLNEYEMRRISYSGEIRANGCVLFPCGERVEPAAEHAEHFAKTCELYGKGPSNFDWLYTRPFNDGSNAESNTHTAFGVASKRNPTQKDLLISLA